MEEEEGQEEQEEQDIFEAEISSAALAFLRSHLW